MKKKLLDQITTSMEHIRTTSSDPDTQVACVITDDNEIISVCANTTTTGLDAIMSKDMYERPAKYDWIEHAERNAIYECAKWGISLKGTSMYVSAFPCVECARAIVQSGISTLHHGDVSGWDNTKYKFDKSRIILESGGVKLTEEKL
jgi:dCMP deaminase